MAKSEQVATKGKRTPWLGIRRRTCQQCGRALPLRAHRTHCATCIKHQHCWHPMNVIGEPEMQACCLCPAWEERRDEMNGWRPYAPSVYERDAFAEILRELGLSEEEIGATRS